MCCVYLFIYLFLREGLTIAQAILRFLDSWNSLASLPEY